MSVAERDRSEYEQTREEINKFLNEKWEDKGVNLDTLLPIILVHKEGLRTRQVFPIVTDSKFAPNPRGDLFLGYSVGSFSPDTRTVLEGSSDGVKISFEADLPAWSFDRTDEKGIILLNKEARMWDWMMAHWEDPSKYVQHIYKCGTATDRIDKKKKSIFIITFAPASGIKVDMRSRVYAAEWLIGAIKHGYAKPGVFILP